MPAEGKGSSGPKKRPASRSKKADPPPADIPESSAKVPKSKRLKKSETNAKWDDWGYVESAWDEAHGNDWADWDWEADWGDEGKASDKAAFDDGKKSLQALHESGPPKKRARGKQQVETGCSKAAQSKRCKKNKTMDKQEDSTNAAPEGTATKKTAVKEKATTKPTATKAKAAAKAKTKAKAKAKTSKAKGPAAEPSQPSNVENSRPDRMEQDLSNMVRILFDFGKGYLNIREDDHEFDLDQFKESLKDATTKATKAKECRFNLYWTRSSVGVTSQSQSKDFAHFHLPRMYDNVPWLLRTAISMKAASLFVT